MGHLTLAHAERDVENRDGTLGDTVGERRSLHQLHHEGMDTRGLLKSVYLGDVRVVQCRQGFRLALETGQTFTILGEFGGEHLDGELSIQAGVGGTVDLVPYPFTEGTSNSLGIELCARFHRFGVSLNEP